MDLVALFPAGILLAVVFLDGSGSIVGVLNKIGGLLEIVGSVSGRNLEIRSFESCGISVIGGGIGCGRQIEIGSGRFLQVMGAGLFGGGGSTFDGAAHGGQAMGSA